DGGPAGGGGAVAEGDPVPARGGSPVTGDRNPDPGAGAARCRLAQERLGLDPELLEGPGPGAFDDDVGRCEEPPERRPPRFIAEVEGHGLLPAVQQVEERRRPRAG